MAYTKIHPIKTTLKKALDYIVNPDKTDEKILVYSFMCAAETADLQYALELNNTVGNSKNIAYHLIQSFLPGETTYDTAHEIGKELADRLLNDKHAYVLATHIDKGHIHNHIIFSATNFVTNKKYYDNKKSYRLIRKLSDEICSSHGLSVINPKDKGTKKYSEWLASSKGFSIKDKLKNDIDYCIDVCVDYDDFITKIKSLGYEVKGYETGDNAAKYIAFRPANSKNFIRGCERSIGDEYSRENIIKRINNRSLVKRLSVKKGVINAKEPEQKLDNNSQSFIPTLSFDELVKKKPKNILNPYKAKYLINLNDEKYKNNPGLLRWAKLQNLRLLADSINETYPYGKTNAIYEETKELNRELIKESKLITGEINELKDIRHYHNMYNKNLDCYKKYQASKNKDKYYLENSYALNIFFAAEHALTNKYKLDPATLLLDDINEDINSLYALKNEIWNCIKEGNEFINKHKDNLSRIRTFLSGSKDVKITLDNDKKKDNESLSNKGNDIKQGKNKESKSKDDNNNQNLNQ